MLRNNARPAPRPRLAQPRITPPRLSQPQVNYNRVVSANHPPLEEELLVRIKRKPKPPASPVPAPQEPQESQKRQEQQEQQQAQEQEDPQEQQGTREQQERQTRQPRQSRRAQQVTKNVASDRNQLPRNGAVVFEHHLVSRDLNVADQTSRQRNAVVKSKIKFSISCVTASTGTSTSGQEDDTADPFAPPASVVPATAPAPAATRSRYPVPGDGTSLLTASLREHSIFAAPASTKSQTTTTATRTSTSSTANRSQSTAPTTAASWFPKIRPAQGLNTITRAGPFQRRNKRYLDENPPIPSCRPYPSAKPKADQLKTLPSVFSPDGSCPGLSPSSITIPARVGRAPYRPPPERPPPPRPAPPTQKAKGPVQPPLPGRAKLPGEKQRDKPLDEVGTTSQPLWLY